MLKTPLAYVTQPFIALRHSHWFFLIYRVVKCAICAILLVPAAVLWGLGHLVGMVFPGQTPRIDWNAIRERPKPPPTLSPRERENITLDPMVKWANELGLGSNRSHFIRRLTEVKGRRGLKDIVYFHLQHVVAYLQNHPEQIEETIKTLNLTMVACVPTWIEASANVRYNLHSVSGPKQYLLSTIQKIKENVLLIDDYAQRDGGWHGMNWARWLRGYRWGLQLAGRDIYTPCNGTSSIFTIDHFFHKTYTIAYLVRELKSKLNLNLRGYGGFASQGLVQLIAAAVDLDALRENDDDDAQVVMKHFFSPSTTRALHINDAGVIVLLQAIGQLK